MSDLANKPKPSFAPVYAAACYPMLAEICRSHGYALAVHGSLQRDFDLIAIPWVEQPSTPDQVVAAVCADTAYRLIATAPGGSPKPHGRVAYTLSIGFGECAVDLQFMPTLKG